MYREKLQNVGIDTSRIRGGQGKTLCPKCSHTRKNKNDRCLSVNTTEGWFRCHHCEFSGNVRERFKKTKEYKIPKIVNQTDHPEDIVQWFRNRGITQETLLKSPTVRSGQTFMPQTNKIERTIQFNYMRNGVIVNVKHRDGDKNFRLESGAELIFYGLDDIREEDNHIVIVEGECFKGDAEVLTEEGWVRMDSLTGSEKVMSVNDDMTSQLEAPEFLVKKEFKGNLVEYSNKQKFYSLTTPDHDLVVMKNSNKEISKQKAKDLRIGYSIPRVVEHDGLGINLTDDQIRLAIAISADFTIRERGDVYGCLKKERKIKRFISILDSLNIKHSCNLDSRGYSSIFIKREDVPEFVFKNFPKNWIYESTIRQKKLIIEEIVHWDGNKVPNREQIEYSSSLYSNAVFIQTISHLCGFTSTIIRRQNDIGKLYKVSVLFKKTHTDSQSLISNRNEIPHDGLVYCVKVSTGKILVRQNECISVSGNCDKLAFEQAGATSVLSVPNGASKGSNIDLEYLDNCWEYFDNDKTIILATDDDEAGIILREELARRLGRHRCVKVDLSVRNHKEDGTFDLKHYKDANEHLIGEGGKSLLETIKTANTIKYPLTGVTEVDDVWDEIENIMDNGLKPGVITHKFHDLDRKFTLEGGRLCIVTGKPNSGKALCIETDIPTPKGMVKMKDIKAGDVVFDEFGKECNVTATTEIMFDRPCYEVVFNDGSKVKCDEQHLWVTHTFEKGMKEKVRSIKNTKQILETLYVDMGEGNTFNHSVINFKNSTEEISCIRHIVSVDRIESVPVKCISVDSENNMYLCTRSYIPTHNSPLCDQIALLTSLRHNWKWGIASMETKPTAIHYVKLAELVIGRRIRPESPLTPEEKDMFRGYTREHIFMIEANYEENETETIDFLLESAEGLVRKNGIRGLIIDPWNKIEHQRGRGESETEYVSRILDKIIRFSHKNGVFVFLVAHPTKPPTNNEGWIPDLYSISGSSNFYNKADYGITIHRNYETKLTEVIVNKMKWDHLGSRGSVKMKFNPANGRLGDASTPPDDTNWLYLESSQEYLDNMEKLATLGENNEPSDFNDPVEEGAPF